eukprot:INCI18867.2.p1 GENE.INCI18867.2~~INCI18867.2.p1  ORF type:complete len:686 (+),score=109.53 INCI18867.2:143-2200(+)
MRTTSNPLKAAALGVAASFLVDSGTESGVVAAQWHGVEYSAVPIWPLPRNISLPETGTADGPHKLLAPEASFSFSKGLGDEGAASAGGSRSREGSSSSPLKISVDASCNSFVQPLVEEAVSAGHATHFRVPVRTYNESAYAVADSAACSKRCLTDADCSSPSLSRSSSSSSSSCYVRSDVRWNSTSGCSPSSVAGLNAPCGCCVAAAAGDLPTISTVSVSCSNHNLGAAGPTTGMSASAAADSEAYTLEIGATTGITLSAASSKGAAAGIASLAQLLRYDSELDALVADVVPLTITDWPSYSWRGIMIDTSRHFVPVGDLLRLVDTMAAAKFNVFHWHVVDSPSFPLASDAYPELSQEGSWSRSAATIYSKADVASVVARGKSRFVDVVVEVDTPAHTLAIARSHPEMMAGQGCWAWMANSGFKVDVDSDDCMALDPTNAAARSMVATLLGEVATAVGPDTPYIHIGGDEVKYGCWNSSSSIQSHVLSAYGNLSAPAFARLQAEWTANVSAAAVVSSGKAPVLWQPTAQGPGDPAWDNALPESSVYMVWLNSDSAAAYAKAGKKVVYTTPYYVAGMGSNGWLNVYNARLMPGGLSVDEQANILGGEICVWGESFSAGNLAFRSLTIGAGAAETFWLGDHPQGSGPGTATGLGLSERFNRFLCHSRRFGLETPPIMPSFCEVVSSK